MRSTGLFAPLAVTWLLLGCGQQQGSCIEAADTSLPEMCTGAQKNTCEKRPGNRWQAFRDEKAYDKVRESCSALGYAERGPGPETYVKRRAR